MSGVFISAVMQDVIVAGRLLCRKDVRWRDPTGLFQKYTESLESANLPSANKISIHHLYSNLQVSCHLRIYVHDIRNKHLLPYNF